LIFSAYCSGIRFDLQPPASVIAADGVEHYLVAISPNVVGSRYRAGWGIDGIRRGEFENEFHAALVHHLGQNRKLVMGAGHIKLHADRVDPQSTKGRDDVERGGSVAQVGIRAYAESFRKADMHTGIAQRSLHFAAKNRVVFQ
jgi:hypothetical protein